GLSSRVAVLYVMVMGFGGDSGGQAPTASLTNSGNRLVLSISEAYKIEAGNPVSFTIGTTAIEMETVNDTHSYIVSPGITFVDAGGDDKISTGDYFIGTAGTEISIIWSSGGTNQVICEGTI
ncbi:MAG TPA: hypothetical protein PKJ15_04060, partial [Methanomassiliicoccales archaeon]|nr:hypothetical protein [Methanomassiliicoccales archaeon]